MKILYKILRSILFSLTLVVVGLYVLVYALLSVPAFTNWVKDLTTDRLSEFIGGKVIIDDLDIYPFNEAKISGIRLFDPEGEECIGIETVGAGISLWKLFSERRIELSFGEIIGLDASLVQKEKDGPLNIDFLIKAFAPKDDNKEKKSFDITLRNVVLRKSRISFSRPWLEGSMAGNIDLSRLEVEDLAADIAFPRISDKGVDIDLRRLSLSIPGILNLRTLAFKGEFSPQILHLENFELELDRTRIFIPDISLPLEEGVSPVEVLKSGSHRLLVADSYVTPADFSFIFPPLESFTEPLPLYLSVVGNIRDFSVESFDFGLTDVLRLCFTARAEGLDEISTYRAEVSDLSLQIAANTFSRLVPSLKNPSPFLSGLLENIGNFSLQGNLSGDLPASSVGGNIAIVSSLCDIDFEGGLERLPDGFSGAGEVNISDLRLAAIIPGIPVNNINANIVAEGSYVKGNPQGTASLVVEDFEFKGKRYEGLSVNASKEGETIDGDLWIHNAIADIEAKFGGNLEGEQKNGHLDMDLSRIDLSEIIDLKAYDGYILSGILNFDATGQDSGNISGDLSIGNLSFVSPDEKKALKLKSLRAVADVVDSVQHFNLKSDWIDIRAEGPYRFRELPRQLKDLASSVFPALVPPVGDSSGSFTSDMDFDIVIRKNNSVPEFFNLPFRLLVPVTIAGSVSASENAASVNIDVPYLQQGKDKLIYDTRFIADIDGNAGSLDGLFTITMPVKRGDLALNVEFSGHKDDLTTDIRFVNTENSDFRGHLSLDTGFIRNYFSGSPEVRLTINPSILKMGPADWNISRSLISYADKSVTVSGLKIWHDTQFVEIAGTASAAYDDVVTLNLNDIDVDYIFDMLQINYVTFGGIATGEISGHALLSGDPVAETESLHIREFTYNGCPLGECLASSRWNNEEKEIEISADISKDGVRRVLGSGGIWIGRDSLSFDLLADKVPVDFVQPFMSVFSSHVGGFATGEAKLFGTFHDIDMTGKIFADSVAVKLDYTNTVYHGSDSVFLKPGRIEIPNFRLYDKFGNSALLTGELTHRYFHEPSFTFRLSDAVNFLCYDTTSDLNPDWYGTLFGTGSAFLQGVPGLVDISADMSVGGNSVFAFVLNETEYAQDYQFLTFSDKSKVEPPKAELTADDFKAMLRKRMQQDEGSLSKFGIDIRATVTPEVLFTLVMDPVAGDKITARGQGAMQMKYESDVDELMMYGKYEILEGNYNFSLQDIILRDFKIKEGSYISFNGDPLRADLDISATYRVNTNLSDLDKSFSTDRDLNRTNVPVDAVLSVNGLMTSPDITFDIELPTLTQDVERKVKSIISTDDMMNRQIIYLLALNRFYTPEYMGASGNGGELAAVASSTISSQLSNILGQLTDKFSVSPSFRSDKGDFSDIEVDVALSSKLLNNRLLINGNFGYRDRSNSSTTFVGDFDVEYLLTKNGNLRLKAYNHFNDQNYYLREALTTQGLGIVFRRDFDELFPSLKKRNLQNSDGNKN